ncbi:Mitochondrial import receptor subunit TOM40B [Liparis tanakae]|uniref:Mitochondrial import receptor subunit TOM40B n=1 Tax=Liparis tanakae TaxID=230148 RepID=A0A4Z2EIR0_9TELE|nr:Mitochondrial import receptor subunit TOM40B [Liparis tanakae]
MGNVLALSSSPGRQNWPFSTDPPPSHWNAHPAHWDSPPRWERRDGRLPNPGSFHSLHRSCKDVFPQQIEGVKMILNKTLSSFFKVTLFKQCVVKRMRVYVSLKRHYVTIPTLK